VGATPLVSTSNLALGTTTLLKFFSRTVYYFFCGFIFRDVYGT
jgi:hypothetical protein